MSGGEWVIIAGFFLGLGIPFGQELRRWVYRPKPSPSPHIPWAYLTTDDLRWYKRQMDFLR